MATLCKMFTRTSTLSRLLSAEAALQRRLGVRNMSSSSAPKMVFKFSMVGATVGALVGTGYSLHQLNKPKGHILNEQTVIPIIDSVPSITPSKSFKFPGDQSGLKLRLYQYQTCPFCCKVRAFLDYHGISYDVIEVDPVLRQATKWSTYKKVPILLAKVDGGYQPLNDSSMIISALSSYLIDNQKLTDIVNYYPYLKYQDDTGIVHNDVMNKYFLMFNENVVKGKTKEDLNEERKWRKWADEVLVHDLSPNVYRSPAESLQAFNWFSDVGEWDVHFPTWERMLIIYVGAFAMWMIGKRLKTKYNLKDDVRLSLYEHCDEWARAIKKKNKTFMGGDKPNLADLSVYGVLCSIEGCDAFKDLLASSEIKDWYFAIRNEVRNHKGSEFQ